MSTNCCPGQDAWDYRQGIILVAYACALPLVIITEVQQRLCSLLCGALGPASSPPMLLCAGVCSACHQAGIHKHAGKGIALNFVVLQLLLLQLQMCCEALLFVFAHLQVSPHQRPPVLPHRDTADYKAHAGGSSRRQCLLRCCAPRSVLMAVLLLQKICLLWLFQDLRCASRVKLPMK